MILISMNKGLAPLYQALNSKSAVVEQCQAYPVEHAFFYVAITRAKKRATLLSYGEVSEFMHPKTR